MMDDLAELYRRYRREGVNPGLAAEYRHEIAQAEAELERITRRDRVRRALPPWDAGGAAGRIGGPRSAAKPLWGRSRTRDSLSWHLASMNPHHDFVAVMVIIVILVAVLIEIVSLGNIVMVVYGRSRSCGR